MKSLSVTFQEDVNGSSFGSLAGGVYFTVTSNSPSPGTNLPIGNGATIFYDPDPTGAVGDEVVYASSQDLGLSDDEEIDALLIWDFDNTGTFDGADQVIYSLATGSPPIPPGADVFVHPAGALTTTFADASVFGLDVDIDALAAVPLAGNDLTDVLAAFAVPEPFCDFNGNSLCDVADVNLMFAQGDLVIGKSVFAGNQYDLDNDLDIDNQDVDLWLAMAATENGYGTPFRRGDTDDIGPGTMRDVDITDFNALASNFTPVGDGDPTNGPFWHEANFDGDDDTDITDFNFVVTNVAPTGSGGTAAIPEPSSIALFHYRISSVRFRQQPIERTDNFVNFAEIRHVTRDSAIGFLVCVPSRR